MVKRRLNAELTGKIADFIRFDHRLLESLVSRFPGKDKQNGVKQSEEELAKTQKEAETIQHTNCYSERNFTC